MKAPALIFGLLIFTNGVHAGPRTSTNYSIAADTVDGGGTRAVSANYGNSGSAGAVTGISTVASPVEVAKHGYIGQLYEPASGIFLAATPATINEGGTRQLSAVRNLDDGTGLTLDSATVTWSVLGGPLTGVSTGGLATAGTVYQDTAASVQGVASGFTASLVLTVLNVNLDNFGSYAGDGIDDAWQVQYFGENNALAAPGADADGDGQNNLFEFRAGTAPTDSGSRLTTRPVSVGGGNFTIELSRVQPGTRYVFQRTNDFATWTDVLTLNPSAVSAPFQQSLAAPGGKDLYRVRLESAP